MLMAKVLKKRKVGRITSMRDELNVSYLLLADFGWDGDATLSL
jgi:hypothetical protein